MLGRSAFKRGRSGGFASTSILTASLRSATLHTGPIEATSVRPRLCLPKAGRLQRLQREWQAAVKRWQIEFDSTVEKMLSAV